MATADLALAREKNRQSFLLGPLLGAALGCVIGFVIVRAIPAAAFAAGGGALIGAAATGTVARVTAWLLFVGALVGGLVDIVAGQIGQSMVYGITFGAAIGICLGLTIERIRKPRSSEQQRLRFGFLILATAILTGYMAVQSSQWSSDLPAETISILETGTNVETFRVSPERSEDETRENINGYPITATGKIRDAGFARRLAKVLTRGGVTQNRKKCGLEPGVAFRVSNGAEAVDLLVCFQCDVLWPHVVGETVEDASREWRDFDPIRGDLLRLVKEAFPEDSEIQNLSTVRR